MWGRRRLRARATAYAQITLAPAAPAAVYPLNYPSTGAPPMSALTQPAPAHTLASAESRAMLASLAIHGAATVHSILAAAGPGWSRESTVSVVHARGIRVTYSDYGAQLSFGVRGGLSQGQPGLGLAHLPYTVSPEVVAHMACALAAYQR